MDDYRVKLEMFEGPLDLLLHLIHKNEVDIFDIPIAMITDQYLEHLDLMRFLDVDMAGDFLIMASTLIHIKSRMLLPGAGGDDDDEDPRMEITRPLLEYMLFREAAEELSARDMLERDVFSRKVPRYLQEHLRDYDQKLSVSLFELMKAFRRVIESASSQLHLTFEPEPWSIEDKAGYILARIEKAKEIFFHELFSKGTTTEMVITFLAILELVHQGRIRIFQPDQGGDIRIMRQEKGRAA
ncbi:MAG TPA: chromosome segregation protein ScpA [Desulfobacteraceae bacterium]|jgi:segregation and condensation protein A|nr:chromosome segregation protein ScpA [Desulfobacteraceae bacterium]